MTFGSALEEMKNGSYCARKGWNGKGMFIYLVSILSDDGEVFSAGEDKLRGMEVLPFFVMKTADNKLLPGWLASQSDMIAEDWEIVRGIE